MGKKKSWQKTEYLTSESCAPKPALHKNSRRAESTSQTLTHTGKAGESGQREKGKLRGRKGGGKGESRANR